MPLSSATAAADPAQLARALEDFLAAWPNAAVFEDGRLAFDMRLAHYSVAAEHGRCLLHFWSAERNIVRTVTAVQSRRDALRLETRRFGQTRPQTLTLLPDPDFRTPTSREASRKTYLRSLERSLARAFPDWQTQSFRSAMDLEHSFGPAYARGILTRGQAAWAVLGIGPDEPPAVIEGALTLGILWLIYCRERGNGRRVVHGLRLIVPRGSAGVARDRMAWLNPEVAQWELLELDPASGELSSVSIADVGNLAIQLPHAFDPQAGLERCRVGIDQLRAMLPPDLLSATEIRPSSATEAAFSLHGLEYARVRQSLTPGSFTRQNEITFGAGPSETLLDDATQDIFLDLVDHLLHARHPAAPASNPLWRLQPERWLESILRRDLSVLDPAFSAQAPVYSQLAAYASCSRTLLDLLTVTRHGRLAVIEIKADDDLHLPLQAIDYWSRIRRLHRDGELKRRGYFPGVELSSADPLLLLVAPALHIHPANEAVLRHISPAVPWELMALDEHWRTNCRVIFRRHNVS